MDDTQDIQSAPAEEEDADFTDELPDYSLLPVTTSQTHHGIPRRGEKDFEPHGLTTQQHHVTTSLEAMIDTLSGLRTHMPMVHVSAEYDSISGQAIVDVSRGPLFNSMGKGKSGGRTALAQEELLYLLERGSLDGRAPSNDPATSPLPFSLQRAYSTLTQLPLGAYTVFANLRRNGYIVSRAPQSSNDGTQCVAPYLGKSTKGSHTSGLSKWWSSAREQSATLLKPGLYRSLEAVQRVLSIVPFNDARQAQRSPIRVQTCGHSGDSGKPHCVENSSLLQTVFSVWKPRPAFRKSTPGKPDFQIAVLSTSESRVPKLWQLDELLAETAKVGMEADGNVRKSVYARLRNERNSAFMAVVDAGITSYVKVTDAQFGRERLHSHSRRKYGKGAPKRVESANSAK